MRRALAAVALVAGISTLFACTRVRIAERHQGTVVDADTGSPIAGATVELTVIRRSTYDGESVFRKFTSTSNPRGEFALPARKKIVDSVTERMEQIQYYEIVSFFKDGFHKREYRSDDEESPFFWTGAAQRTVTVPLQKRTPQSGN